MRARLRPHIASGVCILAAAIFPATSKAQYKEIDHLGKDLAVACMLARPESRVLAVADLQDIAGSNNDQGHYFALIVTEAIGHHLKSGFGAGDHTEFDAALEKREISEKSLATAKGVMGVVGKINVGTIVTGDFRRERNNYVLHLSALRVSDGSVLYSTDTEFRGDDFLDSLAKPFPPLGIGEPLKMKKGSASDEIHPPVCTRCPVPTYTNAARDAKLQGTVVFETVVSASGEVLAQRPRKVLGFGLDEAAYDAIMKKWRMKPATDKAGNPILVIVPIEVTFRLY